MHFEHSANAEEDFSIMRRLYQRFYDSTGIACIEVSPNEAEASKLLANFLLFNKIVTTYDVVGRMCEAFPNIRFENVRKILVAEPRSGSWGLYNSLFSGGSCFIKDAGSLAHQLEQAGARATLVRGILEANVFQRDNFFSRAETEAGFNWHNKSVAVLGVAFKQHTNDIRNSGAIGIMQQLLGAGVARIQVFDPAAMEECKKYFDPKRNELYGKIAYADSEKSALQNADATIICTDWPQFKTLGATCVSELKTPHLIMDGRRAIQSDYELLVQKGFTIIAVGSPILKK
jgi:UDPglucose 6-dehydrogenase